MKLFHAVMAGGVGSRLWPLSRKAYPKQFFNLASDQCQIADTLTRLSGIDIAGNLLLCSQDHKFLAADAIADCGVEADIILEPMGKNTAPAALLAALHIIAHHDDGIILLSPPYVTIVVTPKIM
ncbi:sugar phosphate nucleotidyltransferase [Psychrobacter glacincola]